MPAVVIFHSVPAKNAIFALTMEWVQRREGTKLVHGIAHWPNDTARHSAGHKLSVAFGAPMMFDRRRGRHGAEL